MAIVKRKRKDGSVARGVVVYDRVLKHNVWIGTAQDTRDARRMEAAYRDGVASRRLTFDAFCTEWLSTRGHVTPSTLERYTHALAPARAAFGALPIEHVDPRTVERYVAGLTDGYASMTACVYFTVLRSVFKAALRYDLIERNPTDGITNLPRRKAERTIRPLTVEEHARLVAAMPQPYTRLVELWPLVGLRSAEMFGLTWEHVLPAKILVRQQWHSGPAPLKSEAAWRDVALGQRARGILEVQRELAIRNPHGLVFVTGRGAPISSRNFCRDVFHKAASEAELGDLVPHDLRHTYATWMIQSGANVKALQKMLGHASATLTLDTYGHLMPDATAAAAKALDSWLA